MWYDFKAAYYKGMPFTVVIGGRGIGKTYGALKLTAEIADMQPEQRILFMRRSGTQAKKCATKQFNPYKQLNKDCNRNISMAFSEEYGVGSISETIGDNTKDIGYLSALSTFNGMRGVDLSDVDSWIYDEFTQSLNDRTYIKDEGFAFADAYETIARNRELLGKPPVRVFLFTNANSFYHPIIQYMGWLKYFEEMVNNNLSEYLNKDRGLYFQIIRNSEVSEAKKNTALYKAMGDDSEYSKFSLNNEFEDLYTGDIRQAVIREYKPICSINDYFFIYSHKSRNEFYVSTCRASCKYRFSDGTIKQFLLRIYPTLKQAELRDRLFYESLTLKYAFKKILCR